MKLQQLRCVVAMLKNNLNVSETAASLYTSQPGVSKQIRQLEGEVGVEIFERSGKQIIAVTPAGQEIISIAESILSATEDIRSVGKEYSDPLSGDLRIATTHTQARYVLPSIIESFGERYPRVIVHMHQGTPAQMASMAESGEVDFVIATEGLHYYVNLLMMPCYHWNRAILVRPGHPLFKLSQIGSLTLEALANYPIVTYVFGFTGRSQLDRAFHARQLKPNVVLTAADSDVIKTYVRLGLGVGIIARMAYQEHEDTDLLPLDASKLFAASTTHIGFRPHLRLRDYMFDFIESFAPHLTRNLVETALAADTVAARQRLFEALDIPDR